MRSLLCLLAIVAAIAPGEAHARRNRQWERELRQRAPHRAPLWASPSPDHGEIVVMPLKVCSGVTCPLAPAANVAGQPAYTVNDTPLFDELTKFFAAHDDRYDVLLSFTAFHTDNTGGASFTGLGNDVTGINNGDGVDETWSIASSVGSKALKGFIFMGDMYQCDFQHLAKSDVVCSDRPPYPESAYSLYGILGQEVGHQFGAYVRYRDEFGRAVSVLLGRDQDHWSYLLDSGGSPMEGNSWKQPQPGSFELQPVPHSAFSDLDQYLMGLRPPTQVQPFFLIRSPVPFVAASTAPGEGALSLTGTRVDVRLSDVVSVEGARTPTFEQSPKQTREAFILFVVEGTDEATVAQEVKRVEEVRRNWIRFFYEATRRRMRALTTLAGRDDYPLFDFLIDAEGWSSPGSTLPRDGTLPLTPGAGAGSGSASHLNLALDAAAVRSLAVTMTVPPALKGKGTLEFSPVTGGFPEGGAQEFVARADGKPHRYLFTVGNQERWKGVIGGLRLTPTDAPGDGKQSVSVDLIEGLPTAFGDSDGDTVVDGEDNCPAIANGDQADANGNGVGDLCDPPPDRDGDGVPDEKDNCPDVANADQLDLNGDGVGEACGPYAAKGPVAPVTGCACSTTEGTPLLLLALGLVFALRRRRAY